MARAANSAQTEDQKALRRRGDIALIIVALFSSIGVYFGHDWFHGHLLPAFGISAPLGDALGGIAIIVVAMFCQRLASLAIFRDLDFGLVRFVRQLHQTNRDLRREIGDLEYLATTDKLTGCWNRRHLEAIVPGEIARMARSQLALSLYVVDIDHFKSINDAYGHQVGDQVLIELSARLQASLRASDALIRWGGEEFIVLSPNTSLASAIVVAERSRTLVAQSPFQTIGPATVSIGVAECLAGETWQQWFERADAALYRAKANGRNQVQAAPESPARTWDSDTGLPYLVQLKWHPAFECGNPTIDHEHQILFSFANELLNFILSRRPAGDIGDMIEVMIRQVEDHFTSEETLLAGAGYPRLAQHIEAHRQLTAQAEHLLQSFRSGTLEIGELFQFIAHDVIARHLLSADRDFYGYVQRLNGPGATDPGGQADRRDAPAMMNN